MMSSSIRLRGIGLKIPKRSAPTTTFSYSNQPSLRFSYHRLLKSSGSQLRKHGCSLQYVRFRIRSMDEDSDGGIASFDWEDGEGTYGINSYISSGEESETELVINPIGDVDLPSSIHERFESSDGALAVTSHRFASLQGRFRTHRNQPGVFINMGLIAFVVVLLLLVDWCSWRIVRLPLAPFYLTRPFLLSAALASTAGYLCIPLLNSLRIHQIIRKEGPRKHSSKKGTPTLGGLFFVPIGIIVARYAVGFSSVEVFGVAAATSAFAAIGLLDDLFCVIKNQSDGLPAWVKVLLELVALPAPLGLVCLGKAYGYLTSFCFVSMGNGVNLTDGLDGLAGGTAALSFIGMSITVLPICSDLSIFGVSMAGACIGFLLHNRYKASIFMGDTGSLALGGGLAAMAACTGMFFPLFISSGIFVLEVLSVLMQVSYFKTTKYLYGKGCRLLRMAPLHHHLELCGLKEPLIVTGAYFMSSILAMFAGYVGLISA